MNIRIYNYNNYYNRMVKKLSVDSPEYGNFIYELLNANFNPNDGVSTVHHFGSSVNLYDGSGDYLICMDNNEIISRWFIIENVRERGGQWKATLKRDTIVDYYDDIINSSCFIEKATLPPENPLIFNKEGISVNQIKTKETFLKDETNCAWIVGYYDDSNGEYPISITTQEQLPYDFSFSSTFDEWTEKDKLGVNINTNPGAIVYTANTNFVYGPYISDAYKYTFSTSPSYINRELLSDELVFTGITFSNIDSSPMSAERFSREMNGEGRGGLGLANNNTNTLLNIGGVPAFNKYVGKTLRFSNGEGGYKYYTISTSSYKSPVKNRPITNNDGALFITLFSLAREHLADGKAVVEDNNNTFTLSIPDLTIIRYTATEITAGIKELKMANSLNKLVDAPYSMFCLPYPDEGKEFILRYIDFNTQEYIFKMNREMSLDIAQEISREYSGSKVVYDIQILPYCPMTLEKDYENPDWLYFNAQTAPPNSWAFITDHDKKPIGISLHPSASVFSKNIYLSDEDKIVIQNTKIENECNMYRLVSPNYNGQFEFNAAKNGGVSFFNVDCTYFPFTPYIHVNPNFNLLYGQDFNDARGLICGGDFSITQTGDAWTTYKIQNKNYQEMFNRGIDNLEVQHDVARIQEKWAVAAGAVGAATSGALAGSVGGGIGAAIGGTIAGITSLAAGIKDIQLNEQLRYEALDYKNDMFGYQLDNIKALPNSLTKVSSINNNNKIYPILEFYTCTDEEKIAVANKIAWNGMTVMTIGILKDFINSTWSYTINNKTIESKNYIKAKIIRLNINDDFHVINDISSELDKGVYL